MNGAFFCLFLILPFLVTKTESQFSQDEDDAYGMLENSRVLFSKEFENSVEAQREEDARLVTYDFLSSIIKRLLERLKPILQRHEPVCVPELADTYNITDTNTNATLKLYHVEVYNASSFYIDNVQIRVFLGKLTVDVSLPEVVILSDYVLNGVLNENNATGNGTIVATVTNLKLKLVATAKVWRNVSVQYLQLTYNFDNIMVSTDGLAINGIPSNEVDKTIQPILNNYFKSKQVEISKFLSDKLKYYFNEKFKGTKPYSVPFQLFKLVLERLNNQQC